MPFRVLFHVYHTAENEPHDAKNIYSVDFGYMHHPFCRKMGAPSVLHLYGFLSSMIGYSSVRLSWRRPYGLVTVSFRSPSGCDVGTDIMAIADGSQRGPRDVQCTLTIPWAIKAFQYILTCLQRHQVSRGNQNEQRDCSCIFTARVHATTSTHVWRITSCLICWN